MLCKIEGLYSGGVCIEPDVKLCCAVVIGK